MPITTMTLDGLQVRVGSPGRCTADCAPPQDQPSLPPSPQEDAAQQTGPCDDTDARVQQLAGAVATTLLEVLARRRAVEQVQYLVDEPSLRMLLAWRRQTLWQQTRLHRVRACAVGDGVVEAALVLQSPAGHFGAMLRLASTGRRWQVVLFDVILPDGAMARAA